MPSPILRSITRTPWQAGPEAHAPGPVLVSVTEFTADRHHQTLPIALSGLRLRRSWPKTPGAVGMWLWLDPWRRLSGSVSVWTGERSLYAFVGRPDHLRIVRAHRDRGATRATAWTTDRLDPDAVWAAAHALLTDPTPWPDTAVHSPEGP
ncbi:hypothetical protein ACFQ0X_11405 [Streptomyces rectiviolaceus]|uniref:DUF3291 domain-containing protein n=1 Tax=Streptomyces rectiviolaceus TaxID=332591 RepID=A0ABP6N9C8_9ACTN